MLRTSGSLFWKACQVDISAKESKAGYILLVVKAGWPMSDTQFLYERFLYIVAPYGNI